jgi:hypothetical protein
VTDAHDVPPGLQNLLMILVGNKWPTGDETALRAEADAWRDAAGAVRARVEQVITVKHLVDQALEGGTRQAFDDNVTGLVGTGPDDESAILPMLASSCDSAADALEELANEIETLRVTIIGCLAVLAAQLVIDTALWLFGGEEAAAVETAVTRVIVQLALRRAITTVVTRVAESILAQVGFTLLAQLIERAQGHRRSLDVSQLRTAAINGAVGGAVGVGAGSVGGLLRSGAGKLIDSGADRLPGAGGIPLAVGKAAANLVWDTGFGAVAGMAEGAAQDAAFGLSGDWVSGAANGSFNGAWARGHTTVNPANKLSLSPADHIEAGLDHYFDHTGQPQPPSTPDNPSDDEQGHAPFLETPPPEDWSAWSEGVLNAVDEPWQTEEAGPPAADASRAGPMGGAIEAALGKPAPDIRPSIGSPPPKPPSPPDASGNFKPPVQHARPPASSAKPLTDPAAAHHQTPSTGHTNRPPPMPQLSRPPEPTTPGLNRNSLHTERPQPPATPTTATATGAITPVADRAGVLQWTADREKNVGKPIAAQSD